MAGRFTGRQRHIPDRDLVAFAHRAVHLHRRKRQRRILLRTRIIAAFEQRLVGFARDIWAPLAASVRRGRRCDRYARGY